MNFKTKQKMNVRFFLSVIFIILSLILVFLPENENKKEDIKPMQQVAMLDFDNESVETDLAARYVAENNPDIQFIDLRSSDEFSKWSIPASINIPYEQLFDKKWQGYLHQNAKTNIFYETGDSNSALALALLNNQGYSNNKLLKGGLNVWFDVVMNSEYKGGRLSARENAIFENRRKAKNVFIEINSLPDSVKNAFLEAKLLEEKKLDGGCE